MRPQMLEKVIENWTSRLDYIRASRGSHMPEIIFKMPGLALVGALKVGAYQEGERESGNFSRDCQNKVESLCVRVPPPDYSIETCERSLRLQYEIAMASSGTVITFLDGGQTAHSTLPLHIRKKLDAICIIGKYSIAKEFNHNQG
ncbi:hypothetical protein TNCV_3913431 [Trichonephila clavipes]|nr:hypothetical protein TNCV_3913431 [Trichonephila clavipes]